MKKRKVHFQLSIFNFQLLIALALAFASCADKDNVLPEGARGVSINVTLPDDGSLSRSVPTAPAGYALRCVLEARAKDDNTLKARVEQIAEGTASLTLDFTLDDTGEYIIALWADYIDAPATATETTLEGINFQHYTDKYYRTDEADAGLRHITVVTPYDTYATPDVRDAFTGTLAINKKAAAMNDLSITLTRPLTRLTIAEKTVDNLTLCATVAATYKVPAAINALTGELVDGEYADVSLSGTPPKEMINIGGRPCYSFFTDLVLAPAGGDGSLGTIALAFTATPDAGKALADVTIPAGLPTKRGYRVNVGGNLVVPIDGHLSLSVDMTGEWGTPDKDLLLYIRDNAFRQFCMDNGYADADGNIILAEAAKATSLDVSDKGIKLLQGIEYFTGLTKLDCSYNELGKLDVSAITGLTKLYCDGNKLTELDVTKLTGLKNLSCTSNSLTSIDVSKCTGLTTLNCSFNALEAIDVTKCTELTSLNCNNRDDKNTFTTLDVSRCKKLTKLQCNGNKLTELDVSECTGLKDLNCGGNTLVRLVIPGCPALTSLDCSSNALTTLDVAGCPALTELTCSGNQLTELDVSMTLKTSDYALYCGNQKTSTGTVQVLTLTLATEQTTRWDAIKGFGNNKNVTLKP